MPHVVVQGARPLRDLVTETEPIRARFDDIIVKVQQAFLERGGTTALFPTLTVQGELSQRFFIRATEHDGSFTVRLEPLTDPEKTEPVRLALALVATSLLRASPGAKTGPTNIPEALERVEASSEG